MPSDAHFAVYVTDQIAAAGRIETRRMFGEYAVYCDGKVIGLICDNQFFLKPTASNVPALADAPKGPPYKGARDWFILDAILEDRERAVVLVQTTARDLPPPKPKRAKSAKVPTGPRVKATKPAKRVVAKKAKRTAE